MKVFLWVFSALTICSILVYGIVMAVVPKRYQFSYTNQLEKNADVFFDEIKELDYEEAIKEIYNFCIYNNSAAILSHENESLSFGKIEENALSLSTTAFAADITFADREMEYLLILCSVSQTGEEIAGLFLKLLPSILAVILLLSVLSAVICSRVIAAPIAEISRISKKMTSLDMTWRCDIRSSDEIGVLAASLNTMAARLKATMEELENANGQLSADVRKFRTLEEQRRNFFAAVSHELKTPLTILKGQLENMILGYGDYQNHEKYLPGALEAAEQLERLVKEILSISKMESMDLQDTLQEVSLQTSIEHTLESLAPFAKDKNIRINQSIKTDLVLLVNRNLWDKALSNIIGNAVRHSPCGENVFIFLQPCERGNALIVENTGVFIPEEELKHMFAPFYRADKSRSKATGGSGLGLYIVKTILDLHGMACGMKNTRRGAAFFLYLDGFQP